MAFFTSQFAVCASCRGRLQSRAFRQARRVKHYSTQSPGHARPPLRMAVIGSGPAGFYTAYRVMSKLGAKVDMYEALPVPFGLVRFGVAPDHPEVKNCQVKFEEVAESKDFNFVGNVAVGARRAHPDGGSVPLQSLLRNYHAILFAYGASKDRPLGIPGESLEGVYSAREFVGWYNGQPEHADLAPDLTQGDEAVIVGQGNVALDVARMLLEDVGVLRKTDIADYALEALSRSRVKRVHVVGRRGPMQAAFTIKEVRELMKLRGVGLHPFDTSLIPQDIKGLPRASRRLMDVLLKGSSTPLSTSSKSWSLDFCLSPKEFVPSPAATSRVGGTKLERNILAAAYDPNSPIQGTGEQVVIPSPILFRSIGYKSEPLPGFADLGVPFDERRGIILNDGLGRVLREVRTRGAAISQEAYPGLYCSGWVKRGPTGVIASTMEDAFATGDAIVHDWNAAASFLGEDPSVEKAGWQGVLDDIGDPKARVIKWEDWRQIDGVEIRNGRETGRERSKFTKIPDMLAVLR